MRNYEAEEARAVETRVPQKPKLPEPFISDKTKGWLKVMGVIWIWILIFVALPLGTYVTMTSYGVSVGIQIFVMLGLLLGLIASFASFMNMLYDFEIR